MTQHAPPTRRRREHVVEVLAMTLLDMVIVGHAAPTSERDDATALQQPPTERP